VSRAAARGGAAAATLALLLAGCAGAGNAPVATGAPPERDAPRSAPVALPGPAASHPPARSWHAVRVIPDAPLLPARTVVAAPGDTLDGLARANGASAGALAVANGLANRLAAGAMLAPGRTLTIPAGRWHLVKPGETLGAIAHAYHADFARVAHANGARAPYALEVGDRVLIASAPVRVSAAKPPAPPPATVEARAQAYNLDIEALLRGEPVRRVRPRTPSALRAPPPRGEEKQTPPPLGEVPPKGAEGAGPGALSPQPDATAIRLDWPLTGRILSPFGAKPGGRFNDGINIAADAGAPVKAAADGTVIYAGNGVAAFGGLVLVRHEGGWLTAYAHCSALLVAKGDRVTRGQPIARAGATGEVDAPQLHFEVRRGRVPVDPVRLLPERP